VKAGKREIQSVKRVKAATEAALLLLRRTRLDETRTHSRRGFHQTP